jgi:hypothetical protein
MNGVLRAVVADRFHRTALLGFLAARFFIGRGRLFIDQRITAVVVALEIVRRRFAAQIAVYSLVVHVIFSGDILGVFICYIGHKI